jgi:ribonuclease HI
MELLAVLMALRAFDAADPIEIVSDSTYVVNCFKDKWYEGWLKRDWRNSQRQPVANRDIWEPLIELYLSRKDLITFRWVKGHSGDKLNDVVDLLAVAASKNAASTGGVA